MTTLAGYEWEASGRIAQLRDLLDHEDAVNGIANPALEPELRTAIPCLPVPMEYDEACPVKLFFVRYKETEHAADQQGPQSQEKHEEGVRQEEG